MRRGAVALAALALVWLPFLSGTGWAQGWFEYVSRDYGFLVNFPAEPRIEDTTFRSASGANLPAKRFSAELGAGRYSVLVVDYSSQTAEEPGAMAHAASLYKPRGTLKFEEPSQLDGIPGHQLSITEPDGRQLQLQFFMYSYMGFHRLYIAEGNVSATMAPPAAFWTSLAMVHPDGRIVNITRERAGTAGPPRGGYVPPGAP